MYLKGEYSGEDRGQLENFNLSHSDSNPRLSDNIISALGGLIAISLISIIAVALGFPMVLGPIAASCLLVCVVRDGPFSQPRNILGGHILSTAAALVIWDVFGKSHITIGITLAVVVFLMVISNMVHPPAAASAVVVINTEAGWGFLPCIAVTAVLIIMFFFLYFNVFKSKRYPKRWL
ncbi:HPP family protein [Ammoniphilus sp. YIM 78166]|uniref:HPP family protein n=1 Tax=Ammoniphilus sp. YIM 78166 TaxID=1644106 RepID=UPI0010703C77|nr:HPP family protein [Ammoniphilus sp. YIM 78166]